MATAEATKPVRVLLPKSVQPKRYDLTLDVDLVKFTFDGTETIEVAVTEATNSIKVHSKEIAISKASFKDEAGNTFEPVEINFNLKLVTVEFVFGTNLPLGKGFLSIAFVGQLNNKMAGFYRSSYKAANGETRIMGSTQFEALDARRAFPCWDEPAAKAVFGVTLIVPADRHAFSNMPELESTLLPNGRKCIKFADSPVMSTYLVAFCVGEFDFVQDTTKHGVAVRVYTPPGKCEMGRYGLKVATATLDLYDDFFGQPYPLPKLDMVAIPEFAMGAMENWGLVTYREVDLLIDPAKASPQQRQRVATVVTHELAHQWFGNLVTMAWWDDLWLNEGFATYMQTYAANDISPDWCLWDQVVVDDLARAMRLDALKTSHPIQVPIAHAEEVEEVFDAISYSKGCCVIRMASAIIGPDAFRDGLRAYMAKHQYGNTETSDLWAAWGAASGQPMQAIMSSWTEQMGFPLLTVKEAAAADGKLTLTLEQRWFLADGSVQEETATKKWTIPLIAGGSAVGTGASLSLMEAKEHTLVLPLAGEYGADSWFKLNWGQAVPMRVLYSGDMLRRLAGAIRAGALPVADRAGLLGDAYALAKAGLLDPEHVITLLQAYQGEESTVVWQAIAGILDGLERLVQDAPIIHTGLCALARKLIAPAVAAVGWVPRADDGHLTKLLRATLVGLMGTFSTEDPAVVAEARSRFDRLCADPSDGNACPSDFRVPVLRIVAAAGGQAEYDALLQLFAKFENNIEKKDVLRAIGATSGIQRKRAVLDWATSGAVKLQDFFYAVMSVSAAGNDAQALTWQYLQENFDRLKGMLAGASPSLTDALLGASFGGFTSMERAAEVEKFFEAHPLPSNQRGIAQMLEAIRTNAKFIATMRASRINQQEFWAAL